MNKKMITLGIIGLGLAIALPVKRLRFPSFHFLVSGQVELKRLGRGIFQKTQAPLKLNSKDLLRISQPKKTRILCFGHKFSSPISQQEIIVEEVCNSQGETSVDGSKIPLTRQPKATNPNIPYIISP